MGFHWARFLFVLLVRLIIQIYLLLCITCFISNTLHLVKLVYFVLLVKQKYLLYNLLKGNKMKIITFALQKGGTGKTSVSVSVASELAKHGKVILVDADPQGNASAWYNSELKAELSDILTKKASIGDAIVSTGVPNLYMIPTAGVGGSLNEYQKNQAVNYPYAISDLTDELAKAFDFCIIDTSPHFGALEESCMIASDFVIPVMMIDRFSFDGLEIFIENLNDLKKRQRLGEKPVINRIILNGKDNRLSTQAGKLEALKQTIPESIKMNILPVDQAFKKAQDSHLPIESVDAKKETLAAIEEIAKCLIND